MLGRTFVLAGGRPNSYFRFFRMAFFLPPVARLLCQLSREIPNNLPNVVKPKHTNNIKSSSTYYPKPYKQIQAKAGHGDTPSWGLFVLFR